MGASAGGPHPRPALCPLCPATHSSPLGQILPLKDFSFHDHKVTEAEPLVEGPELVTPRRSQGPGRLGTGESGLVLG